MSDIPVFQRRGYSDAVQTTLTADILSSAVALTVADGASYPAANFFIVIDAGSETSEDVVFVGTRTGNTFGDLRGLDFDHVSGATVAHAFVTQDADEANAVASTLRAKGDLPTRGDADGWERLPVGSNGLPLVAKSSAPLGIAYTQIGPGALAALSLQGAMFVAGASGVIGELAPGDNLQVLQRNTSAPLGVSWADAGLDPWDAAWSPTVTQGVAVAATVARARTYRAGNLLIAHFRLNVTGTGTSTNGIAVSLPATVNDIEDVGGIMQVFDASAATNHIGIITGATTTTFIGAEAGGTIGTGPLAFGLANGDAIRGTLIIETT